MAVNKMKDLRDTGLRNAGLRDTELRNESIEMSGRTGDAHAMKQQTKNQAKHTLGVYLGITIFCGIVFLLYDLFSHGVRSPYMTFLFGWPLAFGVLPALIRMLAKLPDPDLLSKDIYNTGVAAMTFSSLLRGIFEIAGTASDYQKYLMGAGVIFAAAGLLLYVFCLIHRKQQTE